MAFSINIEQLNRKSHDDTMHSVLTSSTNVCGDQDLFLAISEAVDDGSPLFHLHLAAEQRHLVALSGQLPCQPPCSLSCLNHTEEHAVNYLLNIMGFGLAPIVTLESFLSNNIDPRYALCCFIDLLIDYDDDDVDIKSSA